MKPWQRGGLGPLGAVMPLGGEWGAGGKRIKILREHDTNYWISQRLGI